MLDIHVEFVGSRRKTRLDDSGGPEIGVRILVCGI